jgi:hypothetical protein
MTQLAHARAGMDRYRRRGEQLDAAAGVAAGVAAVGSSVSAACTAASLCVQEAGGMSVPFFGWVSVGGLRAIATGGSAVSAAGTVIYALVTNSRVGQGYIAGDDPRTGNLMTGASLGADGLGAVRSRSALAPGVSVFAMNIDWAAAAQEWSTY